MQEDSGLETHVTPSKMDEQERDLPSGYRDVVHEEWHREIEDGAEMG